MFLFFYKVIKFFFFKIISGINYLRCFLLFKILSVKFQNFKTSGVPFVSLTKGGSLEIGNNFKMNNTLRSNPIGRSQKCIFFVGPGATLKIGNNVGISQAAIVCHHKIIMEDNIKIGGGVCIYDTDFHSLNPKDRINPKLDKKNTVVKEVIIKKNAFIGAHSIILKGIQIGENSIVGAGSVVTKSIPDNQIWGGNPAKFIKNVS